MFQNFTGNSRRPRQVNLSGRTADPFAKFGAPQNVVASAQQNRLARQQERERTQAATRIQKTWRAHRDRRKYGDVQRRRWDERQQSLKGRRSSSSLSEEDDHAQLRSLLSFVQLNRHDDVQRLDHAMTRHLETEKSNQTEFTGGPWPRTYLRLQSACIDALERTNHDPDASTIFNIIYYLQRRQPSESLSEYARYYHTVAQRLKGGSINSAVMLEPLTRISSSTIAAYQAFASQILTLPNLHDALGGQTQLDSLASAINCKLLANAVASLLRDEPLPPSASDTVNPHDLRGKTLMSNTLGRVPARTWLLAHLIYFHHHAYRYAEPGASTANEDFIAAVGTLLSSIVDHIELDVDNPDAVTMSRSPKRYIKQGSNVLDPFIREQLHSLVNQESISGLLSQMERNPGSVSKQSAEEGLENDRSRALANYVLTLLRLFPRRGEDIRMWLYLGSNSARTRSQSSRADVIWFFWHAASGTSIFRDIYMNPKDAIKLLKPTVKSSSHALSSNNISASSVSNASVDDQWRTVLIFIELYIFVLRVMDDEEFFDDGSSFQKAIPGVGRGRRNSLKLIEIERLVTFLKNLGFAMYYHASEILATQEEETKKDIASFFNPRSIEGRGDDSAKPQATHIAGLEGVSLDYAKGLVTGLLRSIYERDSRRPFLPKDHWLMTSRFDMTHFIGGVVEEEERRHEVQDAEDEDDPASDSDVNESDDNLPRTTLINTRHLQGVRRANQQERRRRMASRKRYLQAVAPRLEILQNMPFLIPFATRVQIFRRFVHLDQLKRRNGAVDPEMWRMRMMHGSDGPIAPLERHHASIRRDHEFEDAYSQFWKLGQSLKEPINITFIDQFGSAEAGIDGGGVTKEFLTSVTNEVFRQNEGLKMFLETDKHLLYPNPSSIEEQIEIILGTGLPLRSAESREQLVDLLQRYEFLGRIIGKCLYEGILIDIHFASFFLLKWALTGGTGSAPKESGYRAGLNDLRDFDESLYQGLLQLKNYPGDVEDFSLNFTITDTYTLPTEPPTYKTVTHNLRPDGASEPVTNANRLAYISYIARHRLSNQPARQTEAFLMGLSSIIQPSWLSMFNQTELQTLLGGAPTPLDVDDLRKNTYYGGLYVIGDDGEEHPAVQLFWNVMYGLRDEDRRKVVKFVTSTPRAPLLGFGSLNPRFSIRDSGTDETRLPSTSTCVNLLKLPRYTSGNRLKEKLLQAVNAGAGFDLS